MTNHTELNLLTMNRDYEDFHELTKFTRIHAARDGERIVDYLVTTDSILETARNYKAYRNSENIPVSDCISAVNSLAACLQERVSCRSFSTDDISLERLGGILSLALGANRKTNPAALPHETMWLKPYPSGGGLYPIETYIISLNTRPLIAHFNSRDKGFSVIESKVGSSAIHSALMLDEDGVRNASFAIVFTSLIERSATKYGNRGYRFSLLEAGHMAQNVCLVAVAEGFSTLPWGSYYDDEVSELLGIDGVTECVVHSLLIGIEHRG